MKLGTSYSLPSLTQFPFVYELNPYFIIALMVGDNNAALLIDTVKATLACTVPTETRFNIGPLSNDIRGLQR